MAMIDDKCSGYCEDHALSPAELEVLRLIACGSNDKEIAEALGKAWTTVRTHHSRILNKTLCRNSAELARFAVSIGLVSYEWSERYENTANA